MKSMMGENRIFVGYVVRVYGGSKKFMAIIGGLRYAYSPDFADRHNVNVVLSPSKQYIHRVAQITKLTLSCHLHTGNCLIIKTYPTLYVK